MAGSDEERWGGATTAITKRLQLRRQCCRWSRDVRAGGAFDNCYFVCCRGKIRWDGQSGIAPWTAVRRQAFRQLSCCCRAALPCTIKTQCKRADATTAARGGGSQEVSRRARVAKLPRVRGIMRGYGSNKPRVRRYTPPFLVLCVGTASSALATSESHTTHFWWLLRVVITRRKAGLQGCNVVPSPSSLDSDGRALGWLVCASCLQCRQQSAARWLATSRQSPSSERRCVACSCLHTEGAVACTPKQLPQA